MGFADKSAKANQIAYTASSYRDTIQFHIVFLT